jgi:CRP/FNR family transcriptional regulator
MQVQSAVAAVKFTGGQLAVCRGLGQQAASHVVAISSMCRKKSGDSIFAEGDTADAIYEVISGTLRLYKLLPDGRRQVVGFPSNGHLLGVAPNGTHAYSADALTDVVLCRYPRASFHRLMESLPGLAQRLWAVTADELQFAQDQVLLLGRKSALEKIVSFLLRLAVQQGSGGRTVALAMTRGDMADYLGLTIETVSRTLSKLKAGRLIALRGLDAVELLKPERLREIAEGEESFAH